MNTSNFSLANRNQLADMLKDGYETLRGRAKQRFRHRRNELRDSYIKESAEQNGAYSLYGEINAAEDRIQDLKARLAGFGFRIDGSGDLEFTDDGEAIFDKTVDERIKKEIGTEDDIDARFDAAQVAMMTVETFKDAQKLFESVVNQ